MNRKKMCKKIFLCIISLLIIIPQIAYAQQGDGSNILPPTYEWVYNYDFTLDNMEHDERVEYLRDVQYITRNSTKLAIHYPTQGVEVEFLYREMYGIAPWDPNNYQTHNQFDFAIWYYTPEGKQMVMNVGIPNIVAEGASIGDNYDLFMSNVFFKDEGMTICWNASMSNAFSYDENKFVNYTIDFTFTILNYNNETLYFETETFIKFKNFSGSLPDKVNMSAGYGYTYGYMGVGYFDQVYPEIDNNTVSGWVNLGGKYNITSVITADYAKYTYDNGTSEWFEIDKQVSKHLWDNPQLTDPEHPYYYTWDAIFTNVPLNTTEGNISQIYYDPVSYTYYVKPNLYNFEMIFAPIALITMIYIVQIKKTKIKENQNRDATINVHSKNLEEINDE
ncbi:MAG: hypothetical protein ACTSRZ_07595 [Promethearchaeota archaeon]